MSAYEIETDGADYLDLIVSTPDAENVVHELLHVIYLRDVYRRALQVGHATYKTREDNVPITARITSPKRRNDNGETNFSFETIGDGDTKLKSQAKLLEIDRILVRWIAKRDFTSTTNTTKTTN